MADVIPDTLNHPRFCGLWTYRPYGGVRKFCCTVIADGIPSETEMFHTWQEAIFQAAEIIESSKK